jgi:hypothetical protein
MAGMYSGGTLPGEGYASDYHRKRNSKRKNKNDSEDEEI